MTSAIVSASFPGTARVIVPVLTAVLLIWLLLLGSCATYVDAYLDVRILPPADIAEKADWKTPYPGIRYAGFTHTDPPVAVTIMIVDLSTPEVEVMVTPPFSEVVLSQNQITVVDRNGDETMGMKTSTFLEMSGSVAAFNASPFAPVGSREGTGKDVSGLHIFEGNIISPPANGMDALYILTDGSAMIGPQVPLPAPAARIRHAVGGFSIVVHRREINGTNSSRHPRTAVGIADGGKTLIVLVADGRQKNHSVGLTTQEVACWLAAFGAVDGINLDGGGSTTLVLKTAHRETDQEVTDGEAVLLNSPIHRGMPGRERPVANHVGIRIR